ncbi:hypothetical protein ACFVYJ_10325 [Pontibacter sp. JAM-7]|uniref:hypothetical protein n=1 Tax=Pontibacter sp. JAM-7 TaxID=3366581 RepID=UPI003AF82946
MSKLQIVGSATLRKSRSGLKMVPQTRWPDQYARPNFQAWLKNDKNFDRDLLILLMNFFKFTNAEIGQLMDLSEPEMSGVINRVKLRLFGREYQPSSFVADWYKSHLSVNDSSQVAALLQKMYLQAETDAPEVRAIFYALTTYGGENILTQQLADYVLTKVSERVGEHTLKAYE